MKLRLLTAMMIVGALAGCTNPRDDVADERKDLTETQRDAAQDVQNAQAEAIQDVNKVKEDAADDVRDARNELQKAESKVIEGTASGVTSSAGDVRVTPEQCARFAAEKTVRPEDRAAYDACSKMDKDKLAR
ncbi:MAG: hypothetical protein AAB250_01770 [Bdellovibrionota bacterium]